MRKRTVIIAGSLVLILVVCVVPWTTMRHPAPLKVSVLFTGYTNDASGARLAVFQVWNESEIRMRRWGIYHVEVRGDAQRRGPLFLVAMLLSNRDSPRCSRCRPIRIRWLGERLFTAREMDGSVHSVTSSEGCHPQLTNLSHGSFKANGLSWFGAIGLRDEIEGPEGVSSRISLSFSPESVQARETNLRLQKNEFLKLTASRPPVII